MQIFLGSDHAGFELKGQLIDWLSENGHEPEDCGPPAFDGDDDYPVYVIRAATSVIANPGSLGIVIGGSGNGEAIVANRVKGVRCGLCWTVQVAIWSRAHNDANCLSLGARTISLEEAILIVHTWFATPFEGGRHIARIRKIDGA
jgi:ribose 5-phosphate isomerase B